MPKNKASVKKKITKEIQKKKASVKKKKDKQDVGNVKKSKSDDISKKLDKKIDKYDKKRLTRSSAKENDGEKELKEFKRKKEKNNEKVSKNEKVKKKIKEEKKKSKKEEKMIKKEEKEKIKEEKKNENKKYENKEKSNEKINEKNNKNNENNEKKEKSNEKNNEKNNKNNEEKLNLSGKKEKSNEIRVTRGSEKKKKIDINNKKNEVESLENEEINNTGKKEKNEENLNNNVQNDKNNKIQSSGKKGRNSNKKKSEIVQRSIRKDDNINRSKTEILNEITLKSTVKQITEENDEDFANDSPIDIFKDDEEMDEGNDIEKESNEKENEIEKEKEKDVQNKEKTVEAIEEISPTRVRKNFRELSFNSGVFVTENQSKLENNYFVGTLLGEGSFGQVRIVRNKSTDEERAMKIINKSLIKNQSKLLQEINIMKQLDHPNILKIYEYYQDSKNLMIIMERCEGGELFDKILEKNSFSEKEAAFIIHQVLSAVLYAHQHHIVHRDLKPENILLDSTNDKRLSIKVIDWGLATFVQPNEKLTEKGGSAYYIAPEVLIQNYNDKCDIWSVGVILYILLSGVPPFGGRTDSEIIENVRKAKLTMNNKIWEKISDEAKDLIQLMLTKNPEQRVNPQKALMHPWFKILEDSKDKQPEDIEVNMENLEKLQSFHCEQKFQQAVLTYIASQLIGKEEKDKLMKSFIELDKNGDGMLSLQEIFDGYKEIMGEEKAKIEAERIMQEVDLDHSGFIDYTEFLTATMNRKTLLNEKKLKNAFSLFDKDKNGQITVEEIKTVLKNEFFDVDEEVWDEMVAQVDENGDGNISFEEFTHMIMKFADNK